MNLRVASTLAIGMLILSATVYADVWKWTDANGNIHFVESRKPIYVWADEDGKLHYSDSPDHENAVSVEFVWHSSGTIENLKAEESDSSYSAFPLETEAERREREQAERYYCKRATEIYDSYVKAPRLFRTSDAGDREYLSDEEAASLIAETRVRKDELCEGL